MTNKGTTKIFITIYANRMFLFIQYPCVQVCGELTTRLNRTMTILDRCLNESFKAIDQSKNYISSVSK